MPRSWPTCWPHSYQQTEQYLHVSMFAASLQTPGQWLVLTLEDTLQGGKEATATAPDRQTHPVSVLPFCDVMVSMHNKHTSSLCSSKTQLTTRCIAMGTHLSEAASTCISCCPCRPLRHAAPALMACTDQALHIHRGEQHSLSPGPPYTNPTRLPGCSTP